MVTFKVIKSLLKCKQEKNNIIFKGALYFINGQNIELWNI